MYRLSVGVVSWNVLVKKCFGIVLVIKSWNCIGYSVLELFCSKRVGIMLIIMR